MGDGKVSKDYPASNELPEDDDMIDLDDLEASPDDATQLRVDEDFQLAPSMEADTLVSTCSIDLPSMIRVPIL